MCPLCSLKLMHRKISSSLSLDVGFYVRRNSQFDTVARMCNTIEYGKIDRKWGWRQQNLEHFLHFGTSGTSVQKPKKHQNMSSSQASIDRKLFSAKNFMLIPFSMRFHIFQPICYFSFRSFIGNWRIERDKSGQCSY